MKAIRVDSVVSVSVVIVPACGWSSSSVVGSCVDAAHVIGVDTTRAMVERARKNIEKNDVANVEFRLGEIEHLPIADESVDVIISNCVINLSPNKSQVFSEAYRLFPPSGRLAISAVVMTAEIPEAVRADPESVSGCVAGAASISDLEAMLTEAGFEAVVIDPKDDSREFIRE